MNGAGFGARGGRGSGADCTCAGVEQCQANFPDHGRQGCSVVTLSSWAGFKSYNQGRRSFEGVEQDVIWLDEEPPADIYGECLIRTMTTGGIIMITFTPLLGRSEVVKGFYSAGNH